MQPLAIGFKMYFEQIWCFWYKLVIDLQMKFYETYEYKLETNNIYLNAVFISLCIEIYRFPVEEFYSVNCPNCCNQFLIQLKYSNKYFRLWQQRYYFALPNFHLISDIQSHEFNVSMPSSYLFLVPSLSLIRNAVRRRTVSIFVYTIYVTIDMLWDCIRLFASFAQFVTYVSVSTIFIRE